MGRLNVESDEERAERYAENQHKAQLMNHKEALIPLDKLKAKIAKELSVKESYPYDWLSDTYGLHVGSKHTVTKFYKVYVCSWPREKSKYSRRDPEGLHSVEYPHTIPLRDYWRLGLQGKGV